VLVFPLYTATASAGAGGTISPGSASVVLDSTANFTVTPNAGYKISSVTGCAGTLSGNTYTTGSMAINCTVTATFAPITPTYYTLTVAGGTGGTVSPSGAVSVASGTSQSLMINANSGNKIAVVNNTCDQSGNILSYAYTPYTSLMIKTLAINGNCSISVTFVPLSASTTMYTVTASAGPGGTISSSRAFSATVGSIATFNMIPNTGYEIGTVTDTCNNIKTDFSNTFLPPYTLFFQYATPLVIAGNCSVAVTFKPTS
jgi:hypothetical protein